MIYDSQIGYASYLQLVGIGFRAYFEDDEPNMLYLRVGYSHPVLLRIPPDLLVEISKQGTDVTIFGCDRRRVTQLACRLRLVKKPEPYKGKGIRYKGEVIRLKSGKR